MALPSTTPRLRRSVSQRSLEDFTPIRLLGSGSFGTVTQVINKLDGQTYALKRILLSPEDELDQTRLLREVALLSRIQHANIVRFFSAWREEAPRGSLRGGCAEEEGSSTWGSSLGTAASRMQYDSTRNGASQGAAWEDLGFTFGSRSHSSDVVGGGGSKIEGSSSVSMQSLPARPVVASTVTASSSRTRSRSRRNRKSEPVPAAMTLSCGVCQSSYGDWEVDGDDWEKLEAALQPLNLCIPCYSGALKGLGVEAGRVRFVARPKPDSFLCILMECCGATLKDCLMSTGSSGATAGASSSSPLPLQLWPPSQPDALNLARLWEVLRQLASGLKFMHASGLVHRDIKPTNLFMSTAAVAAAAAAGGTDEKTHQGRRGAHQLGFILKIGDLGLAREASSAPSAAAVAPLALSPPTSAPSPLVGSTRGVGSHLYLAPEARQNSQPQSMSAAPRGKCQPAVDLFAAGIVLIELFIRFGTEMGRRRCLQDLHSALLKPETQTQRRPSLQLPDELTSSWPEATRLAKSLLSHDAQARPSAAAVESAAGAQVERYLRRVVGGDEGAAGTQSGSIVDDSSATAAAKSAPLSSSPRGCDAAAGDGAAGAGSALIQGRTAAVAADANSGGGGSLLHVVHVPGEWQVYRAGQQETIVARRCTACGQTTLGSVATGDGEKTPAAMSVSLDEEASSAALLRTGGGQKMPPLELLPQFCGFCGRKFG